MTSPPAISKPEKARHALAILAEQLKISSTDALTKAIEYAEYLQKCIEKEDVAATEKRISANTNLRRCLQLLLGVIAVALALFEVIEISNVKPLLFIGWPAALFLGVAAIGIGNFGLQESRKFEKLFIRAHRKRYGYITLAQKVTEFRSVSSFLFDANAFEKPPEEEVRIRQKMAIKHFHSHRISLLTATALVIGALVYMSYMYSTGRTLPGTHFSQAQNPLEGPLASHPSSRKVPKY